MQSAESLSAAISVGTSTKRAVHIPGELNRVANALSAAWLSPAAMYSVVPAGTKVSKCALGRWEGCNLSHGIFMSSACLSASA